MYYVGHMPSCTEIRQLYANTEAEKTAAAKIEQDPKARAVVDDVNIAYDSVRRLDQTEVDTNQEKDGVEFTASPKKRNGFQRFMGFGETPVETIADLASDKQDVSSITASRTGPEMDVSVSFEDGRDDLVYNKTVSDDGEVYFQRGNEVVGLTKDGLLSYTTL